MELPIFEFKFPVGTARVGAVLGTDRNIVSDIDS